MIRTSDKVENKGFAMIITLVVLILITMVALIALNSSVLEIQIAGNDRESGEIDFAAKTCALLKGAEFARDSSKIGAVHNGAVIQVSGNLRCTTNEAVEIFNGTPPDTAAGDALGFTFRQIRFHATGWKTFGRARTSVQSVALTYE